jgi:hypothetical protein
MMGVFDGNVGEKCNLDKAVKEYRNKGQNLPPMSELKTEYCSDCRERCYNNKSA